MYVSESAVTCRIKTQESIAAVHLNDLLMVTRVTYMNEFKSIYTYRNAVSYDYGWSVRDHTKLSSYTSDYLVKSVELRKKY